MRMKNTSEIDFLEELESLKWLRDSKKRQCYIEDNTTFKGAKYYRAIGTEGTDMFLQKQHLAKNGSLMSDTLLNRVNKLLEFSIKEKGLEACVGSRLARKNNAIYVNSGAGRIIKITKYGVKIFKNVNVMFEINESLGKMKKPDLLDGNTNLLKKYLLVTDDEFILILAFIFNCYFLDTHHLILAFQGPAGSSKTFAQKVVKTVTDPSHEMLRNNFSNTEDLTLAAEHCHVIDINNVSKLSSAMQDVLCTILTGGVATSRTKYTNKSQTSIHTHNPVIMNGIGSYITTDDLLDRSLIINLQRLQDTAVKRVSEKQLWEEFSIDLPRIMGGILNSLSLILKEFEGFKTPDNLNRMADFHILGCVAEKALGWESGSFTRAYNINISAAQHDILDNSPSAQAIIKMMKHDDSGFKGTYAKLKQKLNCHGNIGNVSPRALSADIDRISAALFNLQGIKITKSIRTNGGKCLEISFN